MRNDSFAALSAMLASKMDTRLADAKPTIEHLIGKVEKAAIAVGEAYDVGKFYAPALDVEASMAHVKEGQPAIQAVTAYMGHANSVISRLTGGAFNRLERKKATGAQFLALYTVEELLRTAVAAKAAIARMEAAANVGPMADGTPDFDRFETVMEKVTNSLMAVYDCIGDSTSGEEIVQQMTPLIQRRISGNVQRTYTAMKNAKTKAKPKSEHAARVKKSTAQTTEGLKKVVGTVKKADSSDQDAIGTALKDLYILRFKFPFYFGMPVNKKPKKGKAKTVEVKGSVGKPVISAEVPAIAPTAAEAPSEEGEAKDAA